MATYNNLVENRVWVFFVKKQPKGMCFEAQEARNCGHLSIEFMLELSCGRIVIQNICYASKKNV